jgi:hypothetical protein
MQYQFSNKNDVPNNIVELTNIIDDFFGYKATLLVTDLDKKMADYVLYGSFVLKVELTGRYGLFGAGIFVNGVNINIGARNIIDISMNTDCGSIVKSLKSIDDYCRLRLPDKFLIAFEENNR